MEAERNDAVFQGGSALFSPSALPGNSLLPSEPALLKKALRARLKARAEQFPVPARKAAGAAIAAHLLASSLWREARTVFLFRSLPTEPDTRALCEAGWAEGKRLLLPRCVSPSEMEAVPFGPDTPLRPGAYGIPCPDGPAFRGDPDLILVPCVSVTREGIRLGHGAGYYDRYLSSHGGARVCLCFEELLSDSLPQEDADVRIPLVLTEKGFS